MKTLGGRIKFLRGKLTQEELSALMQVERSTLASWETNRREPDIKTLCRIADFFHVSIDWLVNFQPQTATSQLVRENSAVYHSEEFQTWQEIITLAKSYGLTAEHIRQLIITTGDILAARELQSSKPAAAPRKI